ncbi:AraC family two component transcriptional regulator [Pseudogracilibacillus auburnensis]|uniref:AraC family two component transcriptional regulator n=1 Tax=Pseudogracilibacillus auburnensis TaxID=1494959 RepID=A0A2V3WD20_9BACI|nr:AraC family two component transcriptional regulator [Pseudogracilibacillus auburnensis]
MIKVMVVEDEQTIREGIKILLEEVIMGYEVLWEASNGQRALEILTIEIPDLIITDIRMPKMTGIDFITLLKEKHTEIPVIVISGYDDFLYVREALRLGVKDYLLKPISRKELASILDAIFMNKVKNDEGRESNDSMVIHQIKELIDKNVEGDLSLEYISKALNLHPNYISNLFRKQTNLKLSDYILTRRMEKAKELLKNTNLKIYDIAFLTGFSNPKYFSSVFKKSEGMTPHQYRTGQFH